jgi:hypothetical protein
VTLVYKAYRVILVFRDYKEYRVTLELREPRVNRVYKV